ncbi:unnamed protein product, partial [marine sediment metagenome]
MIKEEEWKEQCEWAGFRKEKLEVGGEGGRKETHDYWFSPYDTEHYVSPNLPPQDMNTLFKWMWIKLDMKQRLHVIDIWTPKLLEGKDP